MPGQGFSKKSPEERREIGKKGGKASHESGNAHKFEQGNTAWKNRKNIGRPKGK
jgi:general stress protein YciG